MNKLLFAVAAVLAATTANAGVRVETVTREVKTKVVDGGAQTILVQDGKVRMQIPKSSGGVILKNSILYVLDDKKKSYMEMDKETMKKSAEQAGAAMKQMQEQMAKMTPEQRAQMQKMMGGQMPPGLMGGKPDTWEAVNTGKTDTSEGRKCTIWALNKNGKLNEELCVVPFASLPGKEDFEKTFKELAASFEGVGNGLPGVGDAAKARNTIKGYPVRTRFFEAGGAERAMETVMTKWVEESVPAAQFEIPAGYKKKEMPKIGG